MYFWRIEKLKTQIASQPLTELEVLPYFIIFLVLMSVVPLFPPETMNIWDYLGTGWTAILAVIGTIYLYRRNGGHAGHDFLQRYFAIGWVATVRWAAVVFPLSIPLAVTSAQPQETTWYGFLFFAIAEVVLYERIGYHLNDVAARKVAI